MNADMVLTSLLRSFNNVRGSGFAGNDLVHSVFFLNIDCNILTELLASSLQEIMSYFIVFVLFSFCPLTCLSESFLYQFVFLSEFQEFKDKSSAIINIRVYLVV